MNNQYSLNLIAVLIFFCTGLFGQTSKTKVLRHSRLMDQTVVSSFNPDWAPFYHGVASGDPTANSLIIWTRVTPETMDGEPVDVDWKIATDPMLEQVVQNGTFTTDDDRDYTVKIDVQGLDPGMTYYYGFSAFSKASLTGKTKTTPQGATVNHLKFGVVSCANYQAGYFNAYRRLADRRDLDAIIHLGDYIYEYGDGVYGDSTLFDDRPLEPHSEIVTLEEYRTRYSTYHLDTSLVRVHQQYPMIVVWDDHESANNSWQGGASNHDPSEGEWEDRKEASKKAFFEWLPIRDNAEQQVYRTFQYGDLVDLVMLDTRLEAREEQIYDVNDTTLYAADRTLMGAEQKNWLFDQLLNSTAKWKLVGQQIVFSEFNVGWASVVDASASYDQVENLFLDMWDGYPAERTEVISFVEENNLDNVVILSGDLHTSFAFDVLDDPMQVEFMDVPPSTNVPVHSPNPDYSPATGEGSVAVEFATPSITSANFDENVGGLTALLFQLQINQNVMFEGNNLGNPNPHMKFTDLMRHGYYILDIKPDSVQANWYFSPIDILTAEEEYSQSWYTRDGENHLSMATDESLPKDLLDVPAPLDPPGSSVGASEVNGPLALLGLYPNPFHDRTYLHYGLNEKSDVVIELYDAQGIQVRSMLNAALLPGLYTMEIAADDLRQGIYYVRIMVDGEVQTAKLVLQR